MSKLRTTPVRFALLAAVLTALALWPVFAQDGEAPQQPQLEKTLNDAFGKINGYVAKAVMWDVAFGAIKMRDEQGDVQVNDKGEPQTVSLKFIVAFLAVGSVLFTFWFGWVNLRGFRHAIKIIRGKYDNPDDVGEISHFRALTSALSATIGLGNIAGVAIAVKTGGPGAIFWMMVLAVFGMTAKFTECSLAQMYRLTNPDGTISGGPMYYLSLGLKEKGGAWTPIGKVLAVLFAILVMVAALGGGNMFQANQSAAAFKAAFSIDATNPWAARGFGIIMAGLVGVVIIGGITRIGAATSRIVPAMCGIYLVAAVLIILNNLAELPQAIGLILAEAFNAPALKGGIVGIMVVGFTRAAFSNEAGIGSAAIAHSAAKTNEPIREGMVAMVGPFIDTIIICFMTGLVLVITGAYNAPPVEGIANEGVGLTMTAFKQSFLGNWFPFVLSLCVVLFAFSTMISWCYYGERGWGYLFGYKSVVIYRIIFVICVFIGAVTSLGNVVDFSDLMLLSMAFPNIIGGLILAPKVKRILNDYWGRYKSGEMKTYAESKQQVDGEPSI